ESCWVSMIVRNRNPGPPESDSCVPPLPDSKLAIVPANRARFVPDVLFSKAILRTALAVVSTGMPVTRYFPLLPTVPVIVIMSASNFMRLGWHASCPHRDSRSAHVDSIAHNSVGGCEVGHTWRKIDSGCGFSRAKGFAF